MTNYYLEVLSDSLIIISTRSIETKLSIGDVLLIKYDLSTMTLEFEGVSYKNPQFKLCERGKSVKSLSISSAITLGYLTDITVKLEREKKLNQLGL